MPTKLANSPILWIISMGLVLLSWHATQYIIFAPDDTFISLRYAARFLQGQGLTWSEGEPVEGYSNFLWILLVSALGALGEDLFTSARILGFLCTAASLIILAAFFLGKTRSFLSAGAAVLLFASCGTTAAWIMGGLEQPLVAVLLLGAVCLPAKSLSLFSCAASSLLLALLAISRPDGLLFTLAICLGLAVQRDTWAGWLRTSLLLGGAPAAAFLAHTLFRLSYYGDPLPNTFYVKISPSMHHSELGLRYVARGISVHAVPFMLALFSFTQVSRMPEHARAKAIIAAVSLIWMSYLIFIGGDVNPPSRHFVPLVVLWCLLSGIGVSDFLASERGRMRDVLVFFPLIFILHISFQFLDAENRDARSRPLGNQGEPLGNLLRSAFAPMQPLLAVDNAGGIPYWSELPSLDMLGLNDRTIARTRPEDFGRGWIGHELGDTEYLFARSPDLIVFCSPLGGDACWKAGKMMQKDKRFAETYQSAFLRTPATKDVPQGYLSEIFIKKRSPLLGFKESDHEIIIPAIFFSVRAEDAAALIEGKTLAIKVDEARKLVVPLEGESLPSDFTITADKSVNCRITRKERTSERELEIILGPREKESSCWFTELRIRS